MSSRQIPDSPRTRRVRARFILLLPLPALIPLARDCIEAALQGKVATGFVISDMAYYMANAREHFDQGFRLTYGNPYASYATPAIYFQPHTFLLGCLERLGLDPGLALNLFGLAALFFASWAAVRFYEEVVGLETTAKRIGVACFFWGGGILSLAGVAAGFWQHKRLLDSVLKFDIGGGWWMFNFGRNLTYPTEAYYHGVFLLSLLFLMRRKWAASLGLAALLSLSHPYSGLSLALILTAYCGLEILLRSGSVPFRALAASGAILAGHLGYYLVFLNRFADHRVLQSQWESAWRVGTTVMEDWLYRPSTYVPALFLVATLAAVRLLRAPGPREAFKDGRVRLFGVWFLAVFALTQHNLVAKPAQPVHFARGNDWMALFFLGAPVLTEAVDRLLGMRSRRLRYAAVAGLAGFLMLDNLVWYGSFFYPGRASQAISLSQDQWAVLGWLSRNTAPPEMVVCQDQLVGYLVSTYTRVRSWQGHRYNTPYTDQRRAETQAAFLEGRILREWESMPVVYVALRSSHWNAPPGETEVYRNNQFAVWGPRQPPTP